MEQNDTITIFIMQFGFTAPRIMITDTADNALITTYGIYVDRVANELLLDMLMPILLPLQQGKSYTKLNFHETEPYVMELKENAI